VGLGLVGFSFFDINLETNSAQINPNEKTVIPQTRIVSTHQETVQPIQTQIIPENKIFEKVGIGTENILPEAEAISSTESIVTLTEWQVKPSEFLLRGIALDSFGNIFYGARVWIPPDININPNTIGKLNPNNGNHTEWTRTLDGSAGIAQLVVDSSDNVYFTDTGLDQIVRLEPSTGVFTSWQLDNGVNPNYIAIDSSENIFFTEGGGDAIGKLNPNTNEVTEWTIPAINSSPKYIGVDSQDMVFFLQSVGNKIVRLNPSTNSFTEWSTISNLDNTGIAFDSSDNVYFGPVGKLGKLDPITNNMTEWDIFGSYGGPLTIDSQGIVYRGGADGTGVKITRMVTSTDTETVWEISTCIGCGVGAIIVNSTDDIFFTGMTGTIGRLTESP